MTLAVLALATVGVCAQAQQPEPSPNPVVVLQTEKGAIGDQPEMDFGGRRNPDGQGFAAFGRVVRGMDVVEAIQASPTGQRGVYGTESLEPPIKIVKAYRQ